MDKDSTVGTPSFFGGTNTTRGMSPGRMGRMKRSLKKRLAAPSTSTINTYDKPPSSPKKVPLPLHPGSSSTLSDYGTISNKGSVDYDDNNNDAIGLPTILDRPIITACIPLKFGILFFSIK